MSFRRLAGAAVVAGGAWALMMPGAATRAQPVLDEASKAQIAAYEAASKPGPNHRLLEPLIGTWEATTKAWMGPDAPPIEMTGRVTKSWTLNGMFVREEVTGTTPLNAPYTGLGFLGFDNGTKVYQGVWLSDVSTGMITYSGGTEDNGKTFVFTGKESNPMDGTTLEFRMNLTIESRDRHVLSMVYIIPEMGEMKAFEMTHTRMK